MESLSLTSVRDGSKQDPVFKVLVNTFHLKMPSLFLPGNVQTIQAEPCFQFHSKLRLNELLSGALQCQFQLWKMLRKP